MYNLLETQKLALMGFYHNLQSRGGFYPSLDYGDGFDLVRGSYFHYVQYQKTPLTQIPDNLALKNMFETLVEFCHAVWHQDSRLKGLPLGEVCIRVLYYEPIEGPWKWSKERSHTDFCTLSIPLFDSHGSVGDPFYGQMVRLHHIQQFRGLKPYPHFFTARSEPRIYVVGFCQLPFESIDDLGQSYGHRLEQLIRRETGVIKTYRR